MRWRADWGALAIAAGIVAAGGWFLVPSPRVPPLAMQQRTVGQGDYTLTTTTGAPFTAASLRGAPSAVFFGYTHCPDVCPTTLGDITQWQEELGPDAARLRIWFITVDPERDTPPILADYLSWSEGITGVTGSRAQIDKALDAFAIFARRVGADADYTMDHTAYVMLFDAKGSFVGTIGYQEPLEQALPKLTRLLR